MENSNIQLNSTDIHPWYMHVSSLLEKKSVLVTLAGKEEMMMMMMMHAGWLILLCYHP
jgi:hypothetical protein